MRAATHKFMARWGLKPLLRPPFPLWLQRAVAAAGLWLNSRVARDVRVCGHPLGGVPGEQHTPRQVDDGRVLLYLHGGAFVIGSCGSHRALASRLASAAHAQAYVIDYRLAPEYPHPAQLQDALTAYRALLADGYDARNILLAGDSAGAALALMTLLAIRERKLPPPAALALISPWVDFTLSGATHRTHAQRDPLLDARWLVQALAWFSDGRPLPAPLLEADYAGAPPTLIHVGSEEILLSDAENIAARLKGCGVAVELKRYDGLWHDFQLHAGVMAEADAALDQMGAFLRQATAAGTARRAA
ncbi:MAG TPA: alpha/beta hydrolase [Nevskiaceae bacterium]|nr:alpha/beta hydrolase [Nevskiaceae bacterium]